MAKKRITNFMFTLAVLILLTSCGDQRIIDRTGFIHSVSLDLLPDGKLRYALSLPIANQEIKADQGFMRTTADNAKEARIILARQTNLLLVSGQLRSVLFGMPLAKAGVWDQMDTLLRDPTISEHVKVIMVNGTAESVLEKKYSEYPRTGKYIDQLIEKEAKGKSIPNTTIYSFARDFYDDGIDPIAPIIKTAKDSIAVDGIALFRDDKYVDKISADDAIILSFLLGSFKHGELNIVLGKKDQKSKAVMFSSLNSSRNIRVDQGEDGRRNVFFDVRAKASLLEYTGELNIGKEADRRKLEQQISAILTKRAEQMVLFLQENKVDSLGIGKYVRNSMGYSEWKRLNWRDEYSNLTIRCTFHMKIKDYGFRR